MLTWKQSNAIAKWQIWQELKKKCDRSEQKYMEALKSLEEKELKEVIHQTGR